EWCGVCKQVQAYLDRKGVKYVAKDIEKDPAAAGELQAKAKEKGIKTGSVPVIDVRGELMVGFNRARLEQLL
ncbi:MAG TPA: glutaredoxin family protein, partial [Nannocystis sp.]